MTLAQRGGARTVSNSEESAEQAAQRLGAPPLAGPEQHDVLLASDEVESAEVRQDISPRRTLVIEVEILECRVRGKVGGADAILSVVRLACCDLALEAWGKKLLVDTPQD